MHYQLK